MAIFDIYKEILNKTKTENDDSAYLTTSSYCLDFFALVGGTRFNSSEAVKLFENAYYEDPKMALKILFYTRDVRKGLGERELFRVILRRIGDIFPDVTKQLIPFVPQYGRYDDLFRLFNTQCEEEMLNYVLTQLKEDEKNLEENKPHSSLAKWMPSNNASSQESNILSKIFIWHLGYTQKEYRTLLTKLRKGLVLEEKLCKKDYSFEYDHIPGKAFFKYRKAFERNDKERYEQFLKDVKQGEKTINANTIYPYEIIRDISNDEVKAHENALEYNNLWKEIAKGEIDEQVMVVRDGSGSMFNGNNPLPFHVATSLAILFANKLKGSFHNKFITFSDTPQLVEIKGESIVDDYFHCCRYDSPLNTSIEKVYNLIIKAYHSPSFKKEDALDKVIIISDMEFDKGIEEGINKDLSTFDVFKKKFQNMGYKMPTIVYWNVNARNSHVPVMKDENNIVLVSGSSKNVIDSIINNDSLDPVDFMKKTVNRYTFVDNIKFED